MKSDVLFLQQLTMEFSNSNCDETIKKLNKKLLDFFIKKPFLLMSLHNNSTPEYDIVFNKFVELLTSLPDKTIYQWWRKWSDGFINQKEIDNIITIKNNMWLKTPSTNTYLIGFSDFLTFIEKKYPTFVEKIIAVWNAHPEIPKKLTINRAWNQISHPLMLESIVDQLIQLKNTSFISINERLPMDNLWLNNIKNLTLLKEKMIYQWSKKPNKYVDKLFLHLSHSIDKDNGFNINEPIIMTWFSELMSLMDNQSWHKSMTKKNIDLINKNIYKKQTLEYSMSRKTLWLDLLQKPSNINNETRNSMLSILQHTFLNNETQVINKKNINRL